MVVSNDNNKGSPKNQGVNDLSTQKFMHTQCTPTPRTFEGKKCYGAEDVAKIIGVDRTTVLRWHQSGKFTADERAHDGRYLYTVERVEQLKSVYHPNWMRGGYEPSPTTSEPEPVKDVPNDHQIRGKKQFKKISAATLETINRLSPDELETHGIIQSARVSGYVCPICGSGDGSNGTGMTQNPKIESHTSLHCFSCGKSFNPLQLYALHYNLEIRRDFPTLVEKICADFEIPIEYEEFAFHSFFRTSSRKPRSLPPLDAKELKNIQADLNASVEPLKTFMKYQSNQKWRGFDLKFLLAHGCRLINDWFPPSLRDTNQQPSTPTSRMIIPSGEASYLARLTDQVKNYDIKARSFIKEKVHAGHKKLFNSDALQNEIVFVVEGYIDALSIELAGFNCVALGGCAEGYLLLDALNKMDKYPQIIILFDSDDAGIKAAKSLNEEILQIKCSSVVRFLSKPTNYIANHDLACASGSAVMSSNNKIDANLIIQKFGVEILRGILQDILDNSLAELNAVEAELGKKDTAGLTDEDWEFIFSGNPSDLAFASRLERFCNDRVKWLTDYEH